MMTKQQVELAKQMHDSGISYSIIAAYFRVDVSTLRQARKQFNNTT